MSAPAGPVGRLAAWVAALIGAILCMGLAGGYFLADDFVQLANSGHWDENGTFAAEVAARFHASIDGVNAFYRPLTFLTFAANYLLGGADPIGWLAVNLALHLASAVLVAFIVVALAGNRTRAALAGAVAAGVIFFALSPGWEVALWVSCRYDALATFFTLTTGACFLARRPAWALAATVAALMCKESGAVAIVLVALLAIAQVESDLPSGSLATRARRWLRVVTPWILVGVAYVALRVAIFGSATHVYRGVNVDLASLDHWRELLASGTTWAHQIFPGLPGLHALFIGSAFAIGAGIALAAMRSRSALLRQLLVLCALAAAPALLLPHLGAFEAIGIGGRLFYQADAFYAIALGLALHEAALVLGARPALASAVLGLGALLVAAHAAWGWKAAREYASVQRSMGELAAELARLAARRGPQDFFIVLIPDAVGRVAFGRNAQAGLMLPPVQPRAITSSLLVQTDLEMGELDAKIDGGLIDALRRHPIFDVMEGRAGPGPWTRIVPTRYFCWNAARRTMVALPVDTSAQGAIGSSAARAYETAGCRDPESGK